MEPIDDHSRRTTWGENHLSLQSKTSISLVLIIVVLFLPFSALGGSDQTTCTNPPAGNPNLCHVYTWNNFPRDNTFTPVTGLFGNDTSYYFQFNTTLNGFQRGLTTAQFTLCTQVVSVDQFGINYTLTLQFFDSVNLVWRNVDQTGAGTAGSLNLAGIGPGVLACSFTTGDFLNYATFGTPCAGACGSQFRIGGAIPNSTFASPIQISLSELYIQLYIPQQFPSVTDIVTCTATSRSLTAFTTSCGFPVPDVIARSVSVAWRATNVTGGATACGTGDNCWRPTGNPGVQTCSIGIGQTSCTVTTSFSPAFTTTTPTVILDWSPIKFIAFATIPSVSTWPILP